MAVTLMHVGTEDSKYETLSMYGLVFFFYWGFNLQILKRPVLVLGSH